MTPEQFKERMIAVNVGNDWERNHAEADDLMCELLRSLGYGDGVDVFEKSDRWYA